MSIKNKVDAIDKWAVLIFLIMEKVPWLLSSNNTLDFDQVQF